MHYECTVLCSNFVRYIHTILIKSPGRVGVVLLFCWMTVLGPVLVDLVLSRSYPLSSLSSAIRYLRQDPPLDLHLPANTAPVLTYLLLFSLSLQIIILSYPVSPLNDAFSSCLRKIAVSLASSKSSQEPRP